MKNLIKQHNFSEYFVDDLLDNDTKVIFVLESPHTQEVKNGYPVAGKSGKDMSKTLFEDEDLKTISFGKLIFEKQISGFGILNVSNIPLQQSAYKNQDDEIFRDFSLMRQNPILRKKECSLNNTIRTIQRDFKNRLELHKDKKIVLCGAFVQKVFNATYPHAKFKDIIEVPHPSFNNWSKQRYAQKIDELLEFIK
jgi:uracil-DNA glycosylase